MRELNIPEPPMAAKQFVERLREAILDFLEDLGSGAQVQAAVVLPGGRQIVASWFGWHGPDMLLIHGYDDAQRDCRVIVEYSAVHILLTALKDQPPQAVRPIGFQSQARTDAPTEGVTSD